MLQPRFPTEQSITEGLAGLAVSPPTAPPALGLGFENDGAYLSGAHTESGHGSPGRGGSGNGGHSSDHGGNGGNVGGMASPDREMPPSVLKILVTNNVAGGACGECWHLHTLQSGLCRLRSLHARRAMTLRIIILPVARSA